MVKLNNKKIQYILLVISTIFFFIPWVQPGRRGILLAVILGIVIGTVLSLVKPRELAIFQEKGRRRVLIVACTVLLEVYSGRRFVIRWSYPNKFLELAINTGIDIRVILFIVSVVIIILSFCSSYIITVLFLTWIKNIARNFSVKSFLCYTFGKTGVSVIKGVVISTTIIVASSVIGLLLLMAVYTIPVDRIEKNMVKSAQILENEGLYPTLSDWSTSTLDNYTDAVIMLEAAFNPEGPLLRKALYVNAGYIGYMEYYNPVAIMSEKFLKGTDYWGDGPYVRYWHGNLVVLKPLFMLFDYGLIRILNTILQVALTALVIFFLYKRKLSLYILPYILSYLMMMPKALGYCLQFSSMYYIYSVGIIMILTFFYKRDYQWMLFLFIGIATAYFDFLTYPIVGFGMVAVVWLITNGNSFEKQLSEFIKIGLSWGWGYLGMWSLKWIITRVLTGDVTAIENALGTIAARTRNQNLQSMPITVQQVISEEWSAFLHTPVVYVAITLLVVYIIPLIRIIANNKIIRVDSNSALYTRIIFYSAIFFLSFAWYSFATNHSVEHILFTNKACVVSFFAVICFAAEVWKINCNKNKKCCKNTS